MIQTSLKSIRLLLLFSLLAGGVYPLLVMGISQFVFPMQSEGSLLYKAGKPIGSKVVAQKFVSDKYFWSRPSFSDYATLPATGSHYGPTSKKLKEEIQKRKQDIKKHYPEKEKASIPVELLTSSASGIDPYLSLEAAYFQAERVAKARNVELAKIESLVMQATIKPKGKFFGAAYINVLTLNLLLDASL